jgi:hypothetical protein
MRSRNHCAPPQSLAPVEKWARKYGILSAGGKPAFCGDPSRGAARGGTKVKVTRDAAAAT